MPGGEWMLQLPSSKKKPMVTISEIEPQTYAPVHKPPFVLDTPVWTAGN
jgi:hypothetical protein